MTGMDVYQSNVRDSLQRQGVARDLSDLEVAFTVDAYRAAMACSHAAASIRAARCVADVVVGFARRKSAE